LGTPLENGAACRLPPRVLINEVFKLFDASVLLFDVGFQPLDDNQKLISRQRLIVPRAILATPDAGVHDRLGGCLKQRQAAAFTT